MLPYSPAIISLFKGVVYSSSSDIWKQLNSYYEDIRNYFSVIGLQVYLDESEGYAFLKEMEYSEEEQNFPRLIEKRQLSYPVTLLCVLLRKKLLESDTTGSETRVILSSDKIKEELKTFLPDISNEARLMDKLGEHINKMVELGFLRRLKNSPDEFEINRIILARITADTLSQIEKSLKEYAIQYE